MSDGGPGGRRRLVVGLAAVLAVAVAAVVAFGVFGVHTLFVDQEVDEAGPVFDSGAAAAADDGVATGAASSTDSAAGGANSSTTAAPPVVREARRGSFVGVEHPGEGSVAVVTDGVQSFVRFEEDFATDNGPDLYVVATVGGQEVELGKLRGNVGAQNYELPAGVDPDTVGRVAVWCKRFDATFTTADLA